MEIEAIQIRRIGGEDDPGAQVQVLVLPSDGVWQEIGREQLNSNCSHCWNLPEAWQEGKKSAEDSQDVD